MAEENMPELGLPPMAASVRDKLMQVVNGLVGVPDVYNRSFPGSMPITFSRRHTKLVTEQDYMVLEKSDGTRYFMLTINVPNPPTAEVILVDRKFNFYSAGGMKLPSSEPGAYHNRTLLDGELTRHKGTGKWVYLIYDVLAVNGQRVAHLNLRQRIKAIYNEVIKPLKARRAEVADTLLFNVLVKDFWEKHRVASLFKHVHPNEDNEPGGLVEFHYRSREGDDGLHNNTDGLILTPVNLPYTPYSCSQLLKWKYPTHNSVDMRIKLVYDETGNRVFLSYKSSGTEQRYREAFFPADRVAQWFAAYERYQGKIVEVVYDRLRGEWQYLRMRWDKHVPNHSSTIIQTLETCYENVRKEEIVKLLARSASHHHHHHTKQPPTHRKPPPPAPASQDPASKRQRVE